MNKDMTQAPDLEHEHDTGPFPLLKPVYQNHMPPCNHACPTGENIQEWLSFAQNGEFNRAWMSLIQNNPFPAISGRICYHKCEDACNRMEVDRAVNIHAVERFLGDLAIENNWSFVKPLHRSGKRILVVGAGPCGLSAAYHLAQKCHEVEVYDAEAELGGMMRYGIPAYRLPRYILEAEIKRLESLGIQFHLQQKIENINNLKREGRFDAVLLATGAAISRRIDIPGGDAKKIHDALQFLHDADAQKNIKIGRRVAVYGGGNTAMDVARTAQRMGAEETVVIYRNDQQHMSAHDSELQDALNEDIHVHWLRRIREMQGDEIVVDVMQVNEQGELEASGKTEHIAADALILAIGQNVDGKLVEQNPGIKLDYDGSILVDRQLMTGQEGIFAGGDMIHGERTATHAFGHGKHAARCIDAWLRREKYRPREKTTLAHYHTLNLAYRVVAPASSQAHIDKFARQNGFTEVVKGLTREQALYESKRCFSCGNCFECDGCMAACPQYAITKNGQGRGYEVDYDKCVGCSICVNQCPANAMEMIDHE